MPQLIECTAVYPTLAVSSVEETCNWYVKNLDFTVRFLWGTPPTHGVILFGEACVHFWNGVPQLGENWLYFDITNLDAMYDRAKASGVEITRPPENYPWGMREFNALDLNGYRIRFGQHLGELS